VGSEGLSQNDEEHAEFLIEQLSRWIINTSKFLKHELKGTLHEVDVETLFRYYDGLYWIADVMKMIEHESDKETLLAREFMNLLSKLPFRTMSHIPAVTDAIKRILGQDNLI
jgi:hypothetical protein